MKPLVMAVVVLFSIFLPGHAMSETPFKVVDTLTGSSLLALEAALPEIHRAKLNISEYKIIVGEDGPVIFVLCRDPELPTHVRGSRANRRGFTVELSKTDLRIVKSYYSK